MHYELCFLHMAHACPYDRQSSCTTFTETAISYIRVTTFPYEGHTSHPSFLQLLHCTPRSLHHPSRLPNLLHWLCLTLLMMLPLWGVLYKGPRQDSTHRSTPTYYSRLCMYICCQLTTSRWGVTCFYQKLRICSCGTKPQHSRNHQYLQLHDDVIMRTRCHHDNIMRTPRIMRKPRFSCSRGLKTPLTEIPLL